MWRGIRRRGNPQTCPLPLAVVIGVVVAVVVIIGAIVVLVRRRKEHIEKHCEV